jgi:histidinol-phosphate aminotransferase
MEGAMTRTMTQEGQADLLERGYSRRQLAGIAAVFGLGAVAAATAGRPAWAIELPAPSKGDVLRLGMNECWTGPMAPGQAAAAAIIGSSNRYYPHDEHADFIRAVGQVEGAPFDHVAGWPGSSDPLCRSIVTFCSPKRGIVTADPTFELAWATAAWLGAPVKRVPLKADYAHDVKAMLAADPNAGLYYICTPNNPTGTVTPLADIEWLVANKPQGSVVLVDEAYIHFAGVPSAAPMAFAGRDVIVLRTFSKIFGMAGMRLGYCMARPEILKKMMRYDGGMTSGALAMPTLVCGTASLTAADLIAARRHDMREARACGVDHVKKRGLTVLPTEANMFMIDWKTKSAKDMRAAFAAQNVAIGRPWESVPTLSRVTVGSMTEMVAFCGVFDRVWA